MTEPPPTVTKYVCRRCGVPCGLWHFGWKHQAGGHSPPTCGQAPDPVDAR